MLLLITIWPIGLHGELKAQNEDVRKENDMILNQVNLVKKQGLKSWVKRMMGHRTSKYEARL